MNKVLLDKSKGHIIFGALKYHTMKKTVVLFMALLGYFGVSVAQTCTPSGAFGDPGLYPKPLPSFAVGSGPATPLTLTFVFPTDTAATIAGFTVRMYFTKFTPDSTGAPPGMDFAMSTLNQTSYSVVGSTKPRGCGKLSGNATQNGIYNVFVRSGVEGYFLAPMDIPFTQIHSGDTISFNDSRLTQIPGASDAIARFRKITLSEPMQTGTSIDEALAGEINFSVHPNPISDQSHVSFNLSTEQTVKLSILDMMGRTVVTLVNEKLFGEQAISLSDLKSTIAPGLYIIRVQISGREFSRKLSIN